MSRESASRQRRSAGHYLADESLTARLQPTLVLAARTLGFPLAMVNILDDRTQHTIAALGEGYPVSTPREETLCDVVVGSGRPLAVADASKDDRFSGLPSVRDGHVRTYVGVPLLGRESLPIGTVCVVDQHARAVGADQVARLAQFGKVVEDQLDLIRRLDAQRRTGDIAPGQLATAITNGEIVPWYQPIVELSSERVVGFEALARWVHPGGAVERPNSFIPLAEDSDLIIDVDLSVFRQALVDLKSWQRYDPAVRLSVNLSCRHFDHADWMAPILAAIRAAEVSAGAVDLELTETARLSTAHVDGIFVRQLQEQGFRVCLDDFGTGWSSLEYLLRLPADGLKIDRVICVALGSPVGDVLIRSVIDLAHGLNMQTTIEGVESPEVAARAAGLGCDQGQGYLWSAPVPAAGVDALHRVLVGAAKHFTAAGDHDDRPTSRLAAASRTALSLPPPFQWSVGDALAGAVLDAIPDATAVLDGGGTIVAVNHCWRMFSVDNGGSEATNGVGVNYLETCRRAGEHGSADALQVATDLRAVLAGAFIETEWEYPCPSPAQRRWFMLRITRLTGPMPGAIASHVNITRRKMAEEELTHAASHDPLTGLANRTLLHRQLTKALTVRAGSHRSCDVGVLYIDLDGFKLVNDTFGHGAGDEVLLTVAHRLSTVIRPGTTIARLGGDEFAVLSPRITPAGLASLKARIDTALAEPHQVHGQQVSVGGSIGVHLATAGEDATDALAQADHAMYTAKRGRQLPS